jgi:hypothetical protein
MNLPAPPIRAALAKLYSGELGYTGEFYEVDGERACLLAPTCDVQQGGTATQYGNGGQKLDYIFADRWHFSIPLGRVSVDQNVGLCGETQHVCSDHYLTYGEMTIQR